MFFLTEQTQEILKRFQWRDGGRSDLLWADTKKIFCVLIVREHSCDTIKWDNRLHYYLPFMFLGGSFEGQPQPF